MQDRSPSSFYASRLTGGVVTSGHLPAHRRPAVLTREHHSGGQSISAALAGRGWAARPDSSPVHLDGSFHIRRRFVHLDRPAMVPVAGAVEASWVASAVGLVHVFDGPQVGRAPRRWPSITAVVDSSGTPGGATRAATCSSSRAWLSSAGLSADCCPGRCPIGSCVPATAWALWWCRFAPPLRPTRGAPAREANAPPPPCCVHSSDAAGGAAPPGHPRHPGGHRPRRHRTAGGVRDRL